MGETTEMGQPMIEPSEAALSEKASAEAQEIAVDDASDENTRNAIAESEGEDDEQPQPQPQPRKSREFWSSAPQLQEGCRRGASSLRLRHTDAYEACKFPAFPEMFATPSDFQLPRQFLDNHAPASARKW